MESDLKLAGKNGDWENFREDIIMGRDRIFSTRFGDSR